MQEAQDNTNKKLSTMDAISLYESTLSPPEMIAYEIAKEKLESSFDISKSIGFREYIAQKQITLIDDH